MRVFILGGYGLIGGEILRALRGKSFDVIGLGRDAVLGRRLFPNVKWIEADLSRLTAPAAWDDILRGVDAVINAAGALQDGPRDRLAAVQYQAAAACVSACDKAGVRRFVQISAVGAQADASTAFMRTKAEGDAAVRQGALDWTILKPGLVISRNAYGGTALIRMLAGFPVVAPVVLADAAIQCVAADDVANAVLMALDGRLPARADYDLVEDEPHRLEDVIDAFRYWLGFRKPRLRLRLPFWCASLMAGLADLAGLFGWRAPLRRTAIEVLRKGIRGDAGAFSKATGVRFKTLDETLDGMPATAQERVFARAELVLPALVAGLGLFWMASGVIGAFEREAAAEHLADIMGNNAAMTLTLFCSAIDIVVGAAILYRPSARLGAVMSFVVAAGYLVAGTAIAPFLWFDPLGAYVKIIPCLLVSAGLALLLEAR